MDHIICIVFDNYLLLLQLSRMLTKKKELIVFDQFRRSIIWSRKAKFRSCPVVIKSIHSGLSGRRFHNI